MDPIAQRVIDLATELAFSALKQQTARERAESAQLARMMEDESGKAFTLAMVDRVFRSHEPARQARQLRGLIRRFGAPAYLSLFQRLQLKAGATLSPLAPGWVMRLVQTELRRSSAAVILPAESGPLSKYLEARRASGTRVNINRLGEAVLGEAVARQHLQAVIDLLAKPEIKYVSVKISAIFSQIHIIDWDNTVAAIKERIRTLYRAAMSQGKFVNLDMEEYRDLELTLAAFQQVLDEPEFHRFSAGLALQGYIPDSWLAQKRLTHWAQQRIASGGAPVKLRIVKGANLPVELVEAELHGWRPAPYTTKADTDANFRRMVEYGCQPEHAKAVQLGVASHNLFDVALAIVLRDQFGVPDAVEVEMLEGMANHQARAVQQRAGDLLVYAPIARQEDFLGTMAYLVRRLEENTAPENFLRDMFALQPGSSAWERQKQRFVAGWMSRSTVGEQSHRAQALPMPKDRHFHNAPDTDWTQPASREALMSRIRAWKSPAPPAARNLDEVLDAAQAAQKRWEGIGREARAAVLWKCAEVMEQSRFETIVEMMHDGKKAPAEGDIEVSEAIDFARYAAATSRLPPGIRATAHGVVVVTPPWNFPYSIPAGGTLAALAAGNAVVLKPAPETVGTAWRLVQHLWDAGVPRDVLQFFPCPDGEVGQALITDPRVAMVVLTGAYETARMFLKWRPSLKLMAETSGKNAIVITAQADRDLAIKDLVRSAFGHAGQKCSAASLAILEAEVYDDPAFRNALRDAAASLKVGPTSDLGSVVTPLIRPAGQALHRALTTLEAGEEWLLEPRQSSDDACLWSPGIKLGVQPGSWFHQTECFGPVLGVMRARDLNEAIVFQNAMPYGLTGGIHSLDHTEIEQWKDRVQVGNAYINRGITGAVVQRQPFGGWKRSSIGPGAKAGGPDYVDQFSRYEDTGETPPHVLFQWEWDASGLNCESNVFRYRPSRGVLLRLEREDSRAIEIARRASARCGVPLILSIGTQETESELAARLPELAPHVEFLRTISPPGGAILNSAYELGINWIDDPLIECDVIEFPRWMRQQSVSQIRHRYGLIQS